MQTVEWRDMSNTKHTDLDKQGISNKMKNTDFGVVRRVERNKTTNQQGQGKSQDLNTQGETREVNTIREHYDTQGTGISI